jgi:hypothetical protein
VQVPGHCVSFRTAAYGDDIHPNEIGLLLVLILVRNTVYFTKAFGFQGTRSVAPLFLNLVLSGHISVTPSSSPGGLSGSQSRSGCFEEDKKSFAPAGNRKTILRLSRAVFLELFYLRIPFCFEK